MRRRVHVAPGTIKRAGDAGRRRAIRLGQEDDAVARALRKMRRKRAELPGHVLMHEENIHLLSARSPAAAWTSPGLFMLPWCTSLARTSCWQCRSLLGSRA